MAAQRAAELAAERSVLRERWYREGFFSASTLAQLMADGARRFPDAMTIFHGSERPAQADLHTMHERSMGLAAGLAGLGLGPGDTIAIQVPNWLEGALTYQAAMQLGAVIVPIVHIYGPAEVGFILRQSGARAFVVPDRWRSIDYLERFDALGEVAQLEHLIVIGDRRPPGAHDWHALAATSSVGFTPPGDSADADDVCLLIYTSGTTAEPKGVQHTHNTLAAEARGNAGLLGQADDSVYLAAFPAGHIASVLQLLRTFVNGTTSIVLDQWDPVAAAALVAEHRVTNTAGAPFHLTSLLEAARAGGHTLASLRNFMVGAASVPPALVEQAHAAGVIAYRAYGSTEHPVATSGQPDDSAAQRSETDGRPMPGNEIRIVDADGRDVAVSHEGEVVLRGPEQFVGYRDASLDAIAFLPGGWFRTGDIGRLDDAGFLTITDRLKDVIIRGGENISSKEVEDILARHPSVSEAAVVAFPDERYGERVAAFVITRPGQTLDLDDVRRHFAEAGVARQKTPERIELVTELPRGMSGKVKKFELRARLRAG